MLIGILKELHGNRVAMIPQVVSKFKALGCDLTIEDGAGANAFYENAVYEDKEVRIAPRDVLLKESDIIVSVSPPPDEDLKQLKSGAVIISMFQPYNDKSVEGRVKDLDIHPFSLDMIPRTTRAQSMDVLSSMASIAGYKAVLTAAQHLPHYFPMLITAAGSIKPSTVLVLGAGVAGLQAIATAKRLGAVVEAFDTRAAAKEEVESLGGKFIVVEGAKDDKGAGGYAVEQSEDFLKRQREKVQERAMRADVIITTAQVRGRKAPTLVPTSTVEKMKKGSVIVDLAASTGGNCALTQNDQVIVHNGVTIVGDSNLADKMPSDSSLLFSNNVINFLKLIVKEGQLNLDMEDDIISSSYIKPKPSE